MATESEIANLPKVTKKPNISAPKIATWIAWAAIGTRKKLIRSPTLRRGASSVTVIPSSGVPMSSSSVGAGSRSWASSMSERNSSVAVTAMTMSASAPSTAATQKARTQSRPADTCQISALKKRKSTASMSTGSTRTTIGPTLHSS